MTPKEEIANTISHVISGLSRDPVQYLNIAAIMASLSSIEFWAKAILYCVSVTASVLASRKYLLEIRRLKAKEKNNDQI